MHFLTLLECIFWRVVCLFFSFFSFFLVGGEPSKLERGWGRGKFIRRRPHHFHSDSKGIIRDFGVGFRGAI